MAFEEAFKEVRLKRCRKKSPVAVSTRLKWTARWPIVCAKPLNYEAKW